MTVIDRFLAKVEQTDTCWIWRGARKERGYGNFLVDGRLEIAHRVAYRLFRGPIPDGLHVCHTCDVPWCVNPGHLFVGTPKDNGRDMAIKERSWRTKLTADKVREIRRRRESGETLVALGKLYGVSHAAIFALCTGKSWTHVL